MFFAIAVTKYGSLTLVGRPYETVKEVEDNFADAWATFNSTNSWAREAKQYGIAQVVQGIELVEPPKFRAVPFVAALPPPAPARDEEPF